MMQLQNLTLTLLLSLLLFLSLGCGEETESPATPPAIDDPQILTPQAIAEVFTEALGREVTIDDLIEKQGQEAAITPPEPHSIEDKIDHLSQQISSVRGEIGEMRQDMNQQMAGVRNEIGKLNQHHADHLKYHQGKAED